ncbi:type II secretion system protein G [Parelusimicrobium proximum]|uniref:type IV pilin protein n=1 Tax=Parelusimicrobium proximum TaxID=3228953 RepID=UPI003D16D20E
MKRGFTLIELLVVVLIIAILAAVALPQYTKAVEKSRATEALLLGKALRGAMDRYYLQNDSWPTSFKELDVEIPGDAESASGWSAQKMVQGGKFVAHAGNAGQVLMDRAGNYRYTLLFLPDGSVYCGGSTSETMQVDGSKKDSQLCQALGGKEHAYTGCYRTKCYLMN